MKFLHVKLYLIFKNIHKNYTAIQTRGNKKRNFIQSFKYKTISKGLKVLTIFTVDIFEVSFYSI